MGFQTHQEKVSKMITLLLWLISLVISLVLGHLAEVAKEDGLFVFAYCMGFAGDT